MFFIQNLFINYSIWMLVVVCALVLGSGGIIIYQYTFQENKQNKELPDSHIHFAYVAIGITVLISFFAAWGALCPPIGTEEEVNFINSKNPRMKSAAVFVVCLLALVPSIDILVQRYLKPNEYGKTINSAEYIIVLLSMILSVGIVIYGLVQASFSADPFTQQRMVQEIQQSSNLMGGMGMY